jgi:hypothetical protein
MNLGLVWYFLFIVSIMSAASDQVYIVTLQRTCNAEDVHNLASELTAKHEDEGQPEFTVDVQNVMKSGEFMVQFLETFGHDIMFFQSK